MNIKLDENKYSVSTVAYRRVWGIEMAKEETGLYFVTDLPLNAMFSTNKGKNSSDPHHHWIPVVIMT